MSDIIPSTSARAENCVGKENIIRIAVHIAMAATLKALLASVKTVKYKRFKRRVGKLFI